MSCPALVVFDMDTRQPVYMNHVVTQRSWGNGKRLFMIAKMIKDATDKYPPTEIAIEQGFVQHNIATQEIFMVHGLVLYIFHKFKPHYYMPTTVKACILHGKATKEEVAKAINKVYPDARFRTDDESDAFAVALTYFIKEEKMKWDKPEKEKKTKPKKTGGVKSGTSKTKQKKD